MNPDPELHPGTHVLLACKAEHLYDQDQLQQAKRTELTVQTSVICFFSDKLKYVGYRCHFSYLIIKK